MLNVRNVAPEPGPGTRNGVPRALPWHREWCSQTPGTGNGIPRALPCPWSNGILSGCSTHSWGTSPQLPVAQGVWRGVKPTQGSCWRLQGGAQPTGKRHEQRGSKGGKVLEREYYSQNPDFHRADRAGAGWAALISHTHRKVKICCVRQPRSHSEGWSGRTPRPSLWIFQEEKPDTRASIPDSSKEFCSRCSPNS